jgi:hypothetical protein
MYMITPRGRGQRTGKMDDTRMPYPDWYFGMRPPSMGSTLSGIMEPPPELIPQRRPKTRGGEPLPRKRGVLE